MNLADAIRKAAKSQATDEPTSRSPQKKIQWSEPSCTEEYKEVKSKDTAIGEQPLIDTSGRSPEPPSSAILSGNAVRLRRSRVSRRWDITSDAN